MPRPWTDPEDRRSHVDTINVKVIRSPGRHSEIRLWHTAPDDKAILSPHEARSVAAALIAAADATEVGPLSHA